MAIVLRSWIKRQSAAHRSHDAVQHDAARRRRGVSLRFRFGGKSYWVGLLDAITVTGVPR
jgi:hypothetical protein